ncbi:hypothetical protein [Leptonema illini]|uniref:hypothetical protein n=1 Tax=Leptonema illini TaxID=183 RepID=UPI003CCB7EB1
MFAVLQIGKRTVPIACQVPERITRTQHKLIVRIILAVVVDILSDGIQRAVISKGRYRLRKMRGCDVHLVVAFVVAGKDKGPVEDPGRRRIAQLDQRMTELHKYHVVHKSFSVIAFESEIKARKQFGSGTLLICLRSGKIVHAPEYGNIDGFIDIKFQLFAIFSEYVLCHVMAERRKPCDHIPPRSITVFIHQSFKRSEKELIQFRHIPCIVPQAIDAAQEELIHCAVDHSVCGQEGVPVELCIGLLKGLAAAVAKLFKGK